MVVQDKGSVYPILSIIMQDILSVPASSVPCEKAFSGAKHMDTDDQNHLSPENLGTIQIAKADMLNYRELQREKKDAVHQEKLQQLHEFGLGGS